MTLQQVGLVFRRVSASDEMVLKQCNQRCTVEQTVKGGIFALFGLISGWFGAFTLATIYGNPYVGLATYVVWAIAITGLSYSITSARDKGSLSVIGSLALVVFFYLPLTGANVTFTGLQFLRPEIVRVLDEARDKKLQPFKDQVERERTTKIHVEDDLDATLNQQRKVRDSALALAQNQYQAAVNGAQLRFDTAIAKLNATVEDLSNRLATANGLKAAEATGIVVFDPITKKPLTTGKYGDDLASKSRTAEVDKLQSLLDTAATTRDAQRPLLEADRVTALTNAKAAKEVADAAANSAFGGAQTAHDHDAAEAGKTLNAAQALYDQAKAEVMATREGFEDDMYALLKVVQRSPGLMVPIALLIFILESLPLWLTFLLPNTEYREWLRVSLFEAKKKVKAARDALEQPTPAAVL